MASPTKGNTTSANPTPANNFYQFNHNQNSGNDRLLVFQLTMANTTYPTTATYGGQTMVRLYSTNRSGLSQRMAFYYLIDPPTGVNVLRVNFNANQWNPISINTRSFTGSGGIGNHSLTGGSSTPNTRTLTITQDGSLVLMTSCSVNQVLTQQIPTGSNKSFVTHNTNRQVASGALSSNSGHSVGSVSLRSTATWGSVTLDRIEIKGISVSPTLTISTTSLSGFTYVEGSGPSSNQTFTVSGDDLSGNATVTAPTNYEISLSSSSGFSQSVSLVQSGGNITGEPKTIYIRLKSSLLESTYNNETLTISSSGSTTKNITLSGSVSPTPNTGNEDFFSVLSF